MNIVSAQGNIISYRGPKGTRSAIVNAANVTLLGGGGVDGAVHAAAGPQLRHWAEWHLSKDADGARCPTGSARLSHAYELSNQVDFLIHAVGPIFTDSPRARTPVYQAEIAEATHGHGKPAREVLKDTLRTVFDLAQDHRVTHLAMPAISCGVFGCPMPTFAKVLHEVTAERAKWPTIQTVTLVLWHDDETKQFRDTWAWLADGGQDRVEFA